jgi:hypothetical protein
MSDDEKKHSHLFLLRWKLDGLVGADGATDAADDRRPLTGHLPDDGVGDREPASLRDNLCLGGHVVTSCVSLHTIL